MRSFKKIIATISIVTMLIASTIVNAAPLDNATANVTLSNTNNDNSADGTTELLTVENIATASGLFDYVEIINNDGVSVYTGSTFTSNTSTGFTIDADFDGVLVADGTVRYTISFTTIDGDFGAAVLVVNQDNRIVVTATVQPVLKFAIEDGVTDFGVLSTNLSTITRGIEVGTNAVNGVTVTAQTVNGGLKSTTASGHTIGLNTNDDLYSSETYSFTSVLGTADSASGAIINGLAITDIVAADDVFTVYSANKPQDFNTSDYDTDFVISTNIAASTPSASDYTDIIIFTATADF